MFNLSDWYWAADGATAQVYSSARGIFVSVSDAIFVDWYDAGNRPTNISSHDLTIIRIDILENSVTPRRAREAVLGIDNGWLAGIESQIETLRRQL